MRVALFAVAAVGWGVLGCGPKPSKYGESPSASVPPDSGAQLRAGEAPKVEQPKTAPSAEPKVSGTPPKGGETKSTPDVPPPVAAVVTPPQQAKETPVHQVPAPNSGGWQRGSLSASALGSQMDQAIAKLRGTTAEGRMDVRTKEMRGYVVLRTVLKDPKHYHIEFMDPSTPTKGNYIVRNEGRIGFMSHDKWIAADFPAQPTSFLDQLHMTSGFGFRPFTGSPYWKGLLERLAKGEGKFKASLETKPMVLPNGEKRAFYRVIAERKGALPATVEIRVDGKRWLPVTVRVNEQVSPKEERFTQWSIAWSFDRPIAEKAFDLPENAP